MALPAAAAGAASTVAQELGQWAARRAAKPLVRALVGRRAADVVTADPRRAQLGAVVSLLPLLAVGVVLLLMMALASMPRCPPGQSEPGGGSLNDKGIPSRFAAIYPAAARRYGLGPRGPAILASIHQTETGFGRLNRVTSSAGAQGHMQFMPGTWRMYGTDANGDGEASQYDAEDAIHSAARYLAASGAPQQWEKAIWAYNHANWYVQKILAGARRFDGGLGETEEAAADSEAAECSCGAGASAPSGPVDEAQRVTSAGRFVPIPGFPGERIDSRLLADIAYLRREYRIKVTDGYALSGHDRNGEHPLGLALDIVPGRGGSWEDVDRLARWAEPKQGQARAPFRWVGYDGDKDHGRGNHLHLSWDHSAARPGSPAAWVTTLGGTAGTESAGKAPCAPQDGGGGDRIERLVAEADRIHELRLPYVYGGGHSTPAPRDGPFDCSSSWSRVLQASGFKIPTMDSRAFMRWGEPGPGRYVTIYADAGHVYGTIDADGPGGKPPRAWGTGTGGRSGGWSGPGWLRYARNPYRGGYVVRHPPGL